jgi:hypothetical protein
LIGYGGIDIRVIGSSNNQENFLQITRMVIPNNRLNGTLLRKMLQSLAQCRTYHCHRRLVFKEHPYFTFCHRTSTNHDASPSL